MQTAASSHLKELELELDYEKWDAFVISHPEGTIDHHSAWLNVLTKTYGHKPFCITLESNRGEIQGVIPFLAVESFLTGKRLVSLPFTNSCDPILPETQGEELIDFAIQRYPNLDYIELKFLNTPADLFSNLKRTNFYLTHILNLETEQEELLKSFHYTCVRQRINRARRNNLRFRISDLENDMRKFYQLLTGVRRKHGLPPQPYAFYRNMWRFLRPPGFLKLAVVENEAKIIAAALLVKFKDKFHLQYSCFDYNYKKLSPNQMLIWECIKLAHREGARYFDFGRTAWTNQSLIDFKDRWATKRYPLTYYYYPKDKAGVGSSGHGRKILTALNRHLPKSILQLEGRLLYPHMS